MAKNKDTEKKKTKGTQISGASMEIPKYKCYKEVHALKIKSIRHEGPPVDQESDGTATITPEDEGYAAFEVDYKYIQKHKPKVGGYYVVYEDGYKSYSPAEAFEEGYTLIGKEEPEIPVKNKTIKETFLTQGYDNPYRN